MEKGPNYKSNFRSCKDDCDFISNSFEHNCIIYYNSSLIETASCNNSHNAICAYSYLSSNVRKTFCSQHSPNCVQADYLSVSNCLCSTHEYKNSNQLAIFEENYQNLAYKLLTIEICHIGLEKRNETYIWSNQKKLNYTNWSPQVRFERDFNYGALTPEGWILTKTNSELNCWLIRKNILVETKNVYIGIEYNQKDNNFSVLVKKPSVWLHQRNNSFPEILCFSDASTFKLYEKLEIFNNVLENNYANFSFYPYTIISGHYWCEGFIFPDFRVVTSKKYFLR